METEGQIVNATLLARNAYGAPDAPIRTERGTELEAFSRITPRLTAEHAARNYPDFARALHENRQLWTILAVDVADENNRLPRQLRAQILYLAQFTLVHSSRVLSGKAGPEALVEINRAIMAGLHAQQAKP